MSVPCLQGQLSRSGHALCAEAYLALAIRRWAVEDWITSEPSATAEGLAMARSGGQAARASLAFLATALRCLPSGSDQRPFLPDYEPFSGAAPRCGIHGALWRARSCHIVVGRWPVVASRAECAATRTSAEAPPSFVMMGSGLRIPLAAPPYSLRAAETYCAFVRKLVASIFRDLDTILPPGAARFSDRS